MQARLADIAELTMGSAPTSRTGGDARFVQIKDLKPGRRSLVPGLAPAVDRASPIREGDILLAARGDPAPVVMADEEIWGAFPTADIYLIRANTQVADAGYLLAFLRSQTAQSTLRESTGGTMLPRIPKKALDDIELDLPPLGRQRQIGALAILLDHRAALLGRRLDAERRWRDQLLNQLIQAS
jgi:restriction endonuclease S subunit